MSIDITTRVTNQEIEMIARTLVNTTELTPRTKASLETSQIVVARNDDKLIGWLISESLCDNVFEIGGAYVDPAFRRHGIFSKLTNKIIDSTCTYLVASYHPYIINHFLNNRGFTNSSLWQFIKLSRGIFLTKRFRSSTRVARHLSQKKAIYIMKRSAA